MSHLQLDGLAKSYGAARAVDGVTLDIPEGEMVVLLGPSGCGKTTILRMVAGFVPPTAGDILLDGRSIARLPPHKRDLGLVFQSYALFPHMTVARNVAFGLEMRGTKRAALEARVTEMLRNWTRLATPWPPACRASFPAASSSAWPSPAPWPSAPACCCWTSRCRTWTPPCAARWGATSACCSGRAG